MSGNERRYSSWTGLYATGIGRKDVGGRDKSKSSDAKRVDVGSGTGVTDPVDWDATAAASARPKGRDYGDRPSDDTSLYYQAVCLISGIGVERSYDRGLARMREAALSGERGAVDWLVRKGPDDPETELVLGTAYRLGRGVERSYEEAVRHLEKAAASLPEAHYQLAMIGIERSREDGIRAMAEAAKLGSWDAATWIERNSGDPWTLRVIMDSIDGLRKGRSLTHNIYDLAVRGDARAIEIVRSDASKGKRLAAFVMGHLYENGIGMEKSREKALSWFLRYDTPESCYRAALLLESGPRPNVVRVVRLYYKASRANFKDSVSRLLSYSDRDDPNVMYYLGLHYAGSDYSKARSIMQRAADLGNLSAEAWIERERLDVRPDEGGKDPYGDPSW